MTKDYIGYQALTDAALRGVVRGALRQVESQGLVGSHHFYLTFKTHFPGVDIPEFLTEQYPEEMTIVLQHQYWGLKVEEDRFEVTLTFKKLPATLSVPFAALTSFADPGVQFGLQFQEVPGAEGAAPQPPAPLAAEKAEKPEPESEEESEKPAPAPGEVVSLDAFRKK